MTCTTCNRPLNRFEQEFAERLGQRCCYCAWGLDPEEGERVEARLAHIKEKGGA